MGLMETMTAKDLYSSDCIEDLKDCGNSLHPLSSRQMGLWMFQQQNPSSYLYNICTSFLLKSKEDRERLGNLIRRVYDIHPAFRSLYVLDKGLPKQQILPEWPGEVFFHNRDGSITQEQQFEQLNQEVYNTNGGCGGRINVICCGDDTYIVQFCFHHMAGDAKTALIISDTLNELLTCHFRALPEPAKKYTDQDYIDAILAFDQNNTVAEQYWENYLDTVPLAVDLSHLPTSLSPEFDQSEFAEIKQVVEFSIEYSVMQDMVNLIKANRSSPFCFFSAVYGILLSRCFRSDKFAVGYVRDVREPEDQNTVGYFIEKLPLVMALDGNLTIQDLLKSIRADLKDHKRIGKIASAKIFERYGQSGQDLSNALNFNIVQTVFDSYQSKNDVDEAYCEVTPHYNIVGATTSTFDFLLDLTGKNGLFRFSYDSRIFDRYTVESLAVAMQALVKQAIAFSDKPIQQLSLIDEHQLPSQLAGIGYRQATAPDYDNIAQVFSERVVHQPTRIAVIEEHRELTYADIDTMSNAIAHTLLLKGAEVGSQIGVCMKRSAEFLATILGIFKIGATYIPLAPSLPTQRIETIVNDSNISLALIQSAFEDKFSQAVQAIRVDVDIDFASPALTNPVTVNTRNDVAVVLYTSGSTGTPKGVVVPHSGLLNTLFDVFEHHQMNDDGRILCRTSCSFDVSLAELFGWFIGGNGAAFILPEDREMDLKYLVKALNRNRITHAMFVPSILKPLFECLQAEPNEPDFPSLRLLAVAGEKFPVSLHEAVEQCDLAHVAVENLYGPTEASIYTCRFILSDRSQSHPRIPIGKSLVNMRHYVVDKNLDLLPPGVAGELCLAGVGIAQGYRNLPEKTAKAFVKKRFIEHGDDVLYRTGDWARLLEDGNLEVLGRFDGQVKLRGQRIELEEIEACLLRYEDIQYAVALVKETPVGEQLVLYYSAQQQTHESESLRNHLSGLLPSYMVPRRFIAIEKMPTLPSGKIDRKSLAALPLAPTESDSSNQHSAQNAPLPATNNQDLLPVQNSLLAIWRSTLAVENINITDNFFELGGHSLLIINVVRQVEEQLGYEMLVTDFFSYPNIKEMASFLVYGTAIEPECQADGAIRQDIHDIAVIGIACRYPEAPNKDQFWQNLVDAKETINTFTETELFEAGEKPVVFEQPSYVKRRGLLDDAAAFDNDIFNYTPREAEVIDPQQRLFLQESYHALEDAGYGDTTQTQYIGVYGGAGFSDYAEHARHYAKSNKGISFYQIMTGNANDFLCTRVAYKLNLSGPAINVQTACSTSLVSVERACRDLRNGLCDMALAGGVSLIGGLANVGYKYQNGMILSPDGHCRTFDTKAEGTVPSQGVGVVLLKPLKKAVQAGDNIYAVVKGVATNNDGKAKVGFTAPDVKGQTQVIRQAQQDAGVSPSDISYIEAHGTATPMGDPIEVAALNQAWHQAGVDKTTATPVQLGSVKSNLGHTDTAAGIAGFIKTALCLYYRQLVPTLHFEQPNEELHLEKTPFQVNTETRHWHVSNDKQRCAGVSAFGVGGTNAHVVLEEAPALESASVANFDAIQLLPISANCMDSLDAESATLKQILTQSPSQQWHNLCYTAQVGRQDYSHRACYVLQQQTAQHDVEAITLLNNVHNPFNGITQISFCFHGVVSQASAEHYFSLYQHCLLYADLVNPILEQFDNQLNISLQPFFTGNEQRDWMKWGLEAALLGFAAELSYAKLLEHAGVNIVTVMGDGGGELTASCFAGSIDIKTVMNLLVRQQTDIAVKISLDKPVKPIYLSSAQNWLIDSPASDVIFTRSEDTKNHINIDQVFEVTDSSLPQVEAVLSFVNGDLFGARTKIELDLFSFSTHQELYDLGAALYAMLGYWWLSGQTVNWSALYPLSSPNRVSIPGYAFEKNTFYIQPPSISGSHNEVSHTPAALETPQIMTPEYLERVITDIWCEHLNLPSIRPDDDFFEIGGESLMAIGVFEDLEHTLNVKLSVSSLYQASTLRSFVALVEREVDFVSHLDEHTEQHHEHHHEQHAEPPISAQDIAPLVLLQAGSDSALKPIFLIHAAGGGLIHFNTLVKSLGDQYTVYGFEAPSTLTFDSIESLAKCYLDALLKVFPEQDSFIIGGHSFGPLVALEMGHQLNKMDKRIETLLLIDPPGPQKMPMKAKYYSQILVHLSEGLIALDEDHMRLLSLEEQIEYMQKQAGEIIWKQRFSFITPDYISRFKQQMDMMFDYEFRPLECDSIYFTPTQSMPLLPADMHEAWHALTHGNLKVVSTPGNHINMVLSPGAEIIANTLRSEL